LLSLLMLVLLMLAGAAATTANSTATATKTVSCVRVSSIVNSDADKSLHEVVAVGRPLIVLYRVLYEAREMNGARITESPTMKCCWFRSPNFIKHYFSGVPAR
jgi:hypothetical protein